jgi:hypothetical protein
MIRALHGAEKSVVMGTTYLWRDTDEAGSPSARSQPEEPGGENLHLSSICAAITCLCAGGLPCHWDDGGLGFPGSDIWCDVDFAYRAHLQGYTFIRAPLAVTYHKDYVMENMESLSRRMEKVGYRAAALFRKHPGLLPFLDMFRDKTPIRWGKDSPRLTLRKLVRWSASTRPALWVFKGILSLVERSRLFPQSIRPIRRWISGGYLYRGYRKGLRDFGPLTSLASVELGAVQKAA